MSSKHIAAKYPLNFKGFVRIYQCIFFLNLLHCKQEHRFIVDNQLVICNLRDFISINYLKYSKVVRQSLLPCDNTPGDQLHLSDPGWPPRASWPQYHLCQQLSPDLLILQLLPLAAVGDYLDMEMWAAKTDQHITFQLFL